MRWFRFLMLGLVSAYPLYWTAQFLLFCVPESLAAFWLGQQVQVISVSYLQVMAMAQPHPILAAHWEALLFALFFSALIIGSGADRYLTGTLAIVVLGQAALLPFLNLTLGSRNFSVTTASAGGAAFGLVIIGLHRMLQRTGGLGFLDRLALLCLLTVLPQTTLWLAFKFVYPFFDVHFLLLRVIPLYLAAMVASAIPARLSQPGLSGVPWSEIFAISAVAGLLIIAIGLSERSLSAMTTESRMNLIAATADQAENLAAKPDSVLPAAPRRC